MWCDSSMYRMIPGDGHRGGPPAWLPRCTSVACGFLATLLILSCSPDLHEAAGPLVPVPNVGGRVLRDGVPVDDADVELLIAPGDSSVASTETDVGGQYTFADVGIGSWMVAVECAEPGDFAQVTYAFVFTSAETSLTIPDLDLSMAALELQQPADGETRDSPNLFEPLAFAWNWSGGQNPLPRFRVRFYTQAGERFWFSEKIRDLQVNWNGLGNEGQYAGVPVAPGQYRWRLRVYAEDPREYTTDYRQITFVE